MKAMTQRETTQLTSVRAHLVICGSDKFDSQTSRNFSDVKILKVSSEGRYFESSIFLIVFAFCYLESMRQDRLFKTSVW